MARASRGSLQLELHHEIADLLPERTEGIRRARPARRLRTILLRDGGRESISYGAVCFFLQGSWGSSSHN